MNNFFYALDFDHTLFDTTAYHQDYDYQQLKDSPVDLDHLITSDGRRLLEGLVERGLRFGIITFGDPDEQRLKLQSTRLRDVPYILAETPDKTALIQQWRQDDGFFHLPDAFDANAYVNEVVLVDDKAAAFASIIDGIHGYLYRPIGMPVLDFQAGEVSPVVTIISTLPALLPSL